MEEGAKKLAQVVLGASHLVQKAITRLLNPTDLRIQEWKRDLRSTLERQASFLCNKLAGCPGLKVLMPQGAMYALVRIDISKFSKTIRSDLDFSSLLLQEENVFVLPGATFGVAGLFRVVFCAPEDVLEQAANRMRAFCEHHILVEDTVVE